MEPLWSPRQMFGRGRSRRQVTTALHTVLCAVERDCSCRPCLKGIANDNICPLGDCQFRLDYYQWTAWILLLQAFIFYLPRCSSGVVPRNRCIRGKM